MNKKNLVFFSFLFFSIILLFHNAFNMHFMSDDFSFYKVSQASNIKEFLNFFIPNKPYFFRPIPTEVYYFIIRASGTNFLLGHIIGFLTYFAGLYFLFKVSLKLTKKEDLSYLFTFMYGISFIHVFQLYMFNTFQEICLFTFLIAAFYFYLSKRLLPSFILFLLALLSKETAILFPVALVALEIYKNRYRISWIKKVIPFAITSAIFLIIYKAGVSGVEQIEIYKIHLSPSLVINNFAWYSFWSIGFPNFLPNYVQSILLKPLPEFWNVLNLETIRTYFYALIFYSIFLVATFVLYATSTKKIKETIVIGLGAGILFTIFIFPTLPIIHRWMVRLTIPLIFLIFFEAYLIYSSYVSRQTLLKLSSVILFSIYIYINLIGTGIHESSGLFLRANNIFIASRDFYDKNRTAINKSGKLYFVDSDFDSANGSKLLKETYHNQDFLAFFFPKNNVKAYFDFEEKKIPKGSFVVESKDLIPY